MTEELKPCPHCGGIDSIAIQQSITNEYDRVVWTVYCKSCDIASENEKEAIKRWNRRTSLYVKIEHGPYDEIYEEGVKSLT